MLSSVQIWELQEIMKEEFDLEITFKEATELGNSLVDCFSLLLKEGQEK